MNGEKELVNRKLILNNYYIFLLMGLFFVNISSCTALVNFDETQYPEPLEALSNKEVNCYSENLTTYIHSQKSGNDIVGVVVISNYSDNNCNLSSPLNIDLQSSNGLLLTNTIVDNFQSELKNNDFVEIFFSWQNGCNPGNADFYTMSITSNGFQGRIIAPLEDPNGNYFQEIPPCNDLNPKNLLNYK